MKDYLISALALLIPVSAIAGYVIYTVKLANASPVSQMRTWEHSQSYLTRVYDDEQRVVCYLLSDSNGKSVGVSCLNAK